MFIPCPTRPGQAQCDFGEALVVIDRVQGKAHCFVLDLPHSAGPDEAVIRKTNATLDPAAAASPIPAISPPPTETAARQFAQYDTDNCDTRQENRALSGCRGHENCAEARTHDIAPVRREHPTFEFMHDGDGLVCE